MLILFWVGVSVVAPVINHLGGLVAWWLIAGATNTDPKQFEHLNYLQWNLSPRGQGLERVFSVAKTTCTRNYRKLLIILVLTAWYKVRGRQLCMKSYQYKSAMSTWNQLSIYLTECYVKLHGWESKVLAGHNFQAQPLLMMARVLDCYGWISICCVKPDKTSKVKGRMLFRSSSKKAKYTNSLHWNLSWGTRPTQWNLGQTLAASCESWCPPYISEAVRECGLVYDLLWVTCTSTAE